MREWLYLVGLSLVWAIGDILYKKATLVVGSISAERLPGLIAGGLVDLVHTRSTSASAFLVLFAGAMVLALGANLGYSIPLSRLPVSVAKPALNTLTLAFVAILGVVLFGETLSVRRVTGLTFVVAGVWLLSETA